MNLPELIERLRTPGDEVFSTRQKGAIANVLEQLAAVHQANEAEKRAAFHPRKTGEQLEAENEALRLALKTENAAAIMYVKQVAHWIEKHDAFCEQLAAAQKDAELEAEIARLKAELFDEKAHIKQLGRGFDKQETQITKLREANADVWGVLCDLVEGLQKTNWSSWQTTSNFDGPLTKAEELIAAPVVQGKEDN